MIPKLLTPNTTNNIAKKLDLLIQMLTQTKQHLDRVEATQKSDKQELLEAI